MTSNIQPALSHWMSAQHPSHYFSRHTFCICLPNWDLGYCLLSVQSYSFIPHLILYVTEKLLFFIFMNHQYQKHVPRWYIWTNKQRKKFKSKKESDLNWLSFQFVRQSFHKCRFMNTKECRFENRCHWLPRKQSGNSTKGRWSRGTLYSWN